MFFSSYGSLIHDVLASYYRGEIPAGDALTKFLIRFPSEVSGAYPSEQIRASYFQQGVDCMKAMQPIDGRILGVEERVSFELGGKPFIGFVDMIYEDRDGALCVMDHKSHALKPRSARKKPTKTDLELDEYLRQLYLYSVPVAKRFGRDPDFLEFNCYRIGTHIKERFCKQAQSEAIQWSLDMIEAVRKESEWRPNLDFWQCRFLCGFFSECEYAQVATF